jgi:hypothetical protein
VANSLIVPVGVNLDPFKASMDEATRIATSAVQDIQMQFNNANIGIAANVIQGLAQGFGQGMFQAMTGLLKMVTENIAAMAKLGDQAKLARIDVESFQELMAGGTKGGLSSKEAAQNLVTVATKLNDANRDENELTKLLDANNIKWKDTKGNVIDVATAMKGIASLIANAKTPLDAQKIAEIAGISKEWIKTLEGGPEALAKAGEAARAAGGIMSAEMIAQAKKFEEDWTAALQALGTGSKQWLLPIIQMLNQAIELANSLISMGMALRRLDAGSATRSDLARIEAGRVEEFGGHIPRDIQTAIAKRRAELDAQGAAIVTVTPQKTAGTTIPGKAEAEEDKTRLEAVTDAVERHTAAMIADANAVGLNAGKHEQLRAELKVLQAIKEDDNDITDAQIAKYGELRRTMDATQARQAAGIALTVDQAKAFDRLSDSTKAAADKLAETKRSFEGINDAMRFAGNQLVDILDQATQKGAKFGDIMAQVLRNVSKQLLMAAITGEGAFAKMLGTSSTTGGVGGLMGIIAAGFKGGGAPTMTTGIAGSLPVPTFAEGGTIPAGGLAYVGEHGPNPRLIQAGAKPIMVTPNNIGNSGNGTIVGPTTHIVIQGSADESTVAAMQQMLAMRDRRFVADVARANSELRRRSVFA